MTTVQIDPVEYTAQRISDGFTDLLLEAQTTQNHARAMVIWQLLRRLEQEAAHVSGKVSEHAERLCGYGHGV